jgi:hypothetical protein
MATEADPGKFRAAAEEIVRSGGLGKSEVHRNLFLYLLERSLANSPPREIEIAFDVFHKDASFTGSEDSLVRVHVRSLRTKLEEYYREAGKASSLRLSIPKGAYRLIAQPNTEAPPESPTDRPAPQLVQTSTRRRGVWAALLGILVASLVLNSYLWTSRAELPAQRVDPVSASPVWKGILAGTRPITFVLGDFFLFSQVLEDGTTVRVVHPRVRTSEDLKSYAREQGNQDNAIGESQTTLLPKSVMTGFAAIVPMMETTSREWSIRLSSELRFEDLRDTDIIYMGPMSRMGRLGDFLYSTSALRFHQEGYTIEDTSADVSYSGTGVDPGLLTDYGLFAAFPGPGNNRIFVLANAGKDIGLLGLVQSITSTAGLADIQNKLLAAKGSADGFYEVLFAVSGYERTDLSAKVVVARPLASADR